MRKQILIAAGLAALSTSAWATKARLQALGQESSFGSLYYSDTRSVFKNPAYINEYNNFVVTEIARGGAGSSEAEGGFYKSAGNFNYGLSFTNSGLNTIDSDTLAQANALAGNSLIGSSGELQAFIGGDAGIQWGASISIGDNEVEPTGGVTQEYSSLGLNFGAIMGNIEAYARLSLKNDSETGSDSVEGDLSPTIGVAYTMSNNTFFAEFQKESGEATVGGGTAELDDTSFRVGWGRVHKVSDSARVYTDVMFESTSEESTSAGTTSETDGTSIPVRVGMEADANSWLTVRGSVSHNVYGSNDTPANALTGAVATERSGIAGATTVGAGATLNFGKLKVDGAVSTETAHSGFETRVGVHYWF